MTVLLYIFQSTQLYNKNIG